MKFNITYFDDHLDNIECYQELFEDDFLITGHTNSADYEEALKLTRPHGILLDLHMPTLDGLELYGKIIVSDHYNGCPIFFISGDASNDSRLKMIQTGGVDVFSRTINCSELKVRLSNKIKLFLQGHTVIDVDNLTLDTSLFTLSVNQVPVDLTLIEMRILSIVIRQIPKSIPKEQLMVQIWGDSKAQGKLNVHLSNLKIKLQGWSHEIKIRGNLVSVSKI
jgi:DNA-binding response OmpR family regulator